MDQVPQTPGGGLLLAACCCGVPLLIALWFFIIKRSADRDRRTGRCSACGGSGYTFEGNNQFRTPCRSCQTYS